MAINSESFSIWKESMTKLKAILRDAKQANEEHRGWLMTLCGSAHLDFSDLPVILPHMFRSVVGPRATISIFFQATYTQMGLLRQRERERLQLEASSKSASTESFDHNKPNAEALRVDIPQEETQEQRQKRCELTRMLSSAMMTPCKEYPGIGWASMTMSPDSPEAHTWFERPKVKRHGSKRESITGPRSAHSHEEHDERTLIGHSPMITSPTQMSATPATPTTGSEGKPQRPKFGGVVAHRTPSGNLVGERRPTDTSVDFIENTRLDEVEEDIDQDAAEVLKHTQAMSDRLSYKKLKVHSVLALLLRAQGIRPGLSQPGTLLMHQLDPPKETVEQASI